MRRIPELIERAVDHAAAQRPARSVKPATARKGSTWLLGGILMLSSCGGTDRPTAGDVTLSADEACELLIDHALRSAFGAWRTRYHYVIWCNKPISPNEIVVTITPAAGQEEFNDPDLMKTSARSAIDAIVKRKGWAKRYPVIHVQFVR